MSNTPEHDELAGTEQPFVQHLMELRDRLVKSTLAVAVAGAVLAIFPGPAELYDFYGVFSGRRWNQQIYPRVREVIHASLG